MYTFYIKYIVTARSDNSFIYFSGLNVGLMGKEKK